MTHAKGMVEYTNERCRRVFVALIK